MKVIAVANQKGGIGKTTTSMALASILKDKGYKTLLIDTDEQCNSTDTYEAKIEENCTLYDVLLEDPQANINDAIQHTANGDIVASDPLLEKAESKLSGEMDCFLRLKNALKELKGYDYVVLDTAPNLDVILKNCLLCADYVIIPTTADRYAVQGLSRLNKQISVAKANQNKKIKIAGILLIKYSDRTALNKDVKESLEDIAKKMNTKLFNTNIRETVRVREAQTTHINLIEYAPNCTASIDYKNLVEEFLEDTKKGKK